MKNIIISFAVLILFVSCSDSFLESTPVMSETEESFYVNDEQMFKALVACYDPLQYSADAPLSPVVPFGEIRSDNARTGGGSDQDQPDMQDIEAFRNTSVNSISEVAWKYRYKGIYRCNLVINSEYDSDLAKIYKAEAKFLRAWYHFDLMRYYGPCVVSTQTLYPAGHKFVRNTRLEVNKQIEKDLLEAIPVLEETFPADMTGRIRKSAAQALLAKVYLYWADWTNDDKDMFDKVIPLLEGEEGVMKSGLYSLYNDFSKLFAAYNENNSESIFEVQRCTTGGWTDGNNKDGSEGNFYARFLGPRSLSKNPDYKAGYGFLLPTEELYKYFLADDTKRRDAVVFTYDDLVTKPNEQITEPAKKVKWDISSYGPDFEGFAQRKYPQFLSYTITGNQNFNQPGNERLLRYGEVYLMLAEAYLRGTNVNEDKAKYYIDELRKYHVGGGSDTYRKVDDLLREHPDRFHNVMDVLWYELRCELAGEGDRWFDLVRTGRAEEVMMPILREKYGITQWDKKFNYLPIGSIEITNSGGSLTEYPDEVNQ